MACLLHMQGEHGFSFLFALSEGHYRAFPDMCYPGGELRASWE